MEGQDPGSRKISTRCRFCGNDESVADKEDAALRSHFQVIVACASCGRQFTVLSAN
jgi:uncharacterized Zn finger protein